MIKKFAVLIFLIFLTFPAFAHEYWLEPERFFIAPNEKTNLRLFVGEGLKNPEERPFQTTKTPFFQIYSNGSGIDLTKSLVDNAMPIYSLSPEKPGNYLFGLERTWSFIKLEPKDFDGYLREDGMEYIIAEREKLGESQKEGRERYARFLKTLVQVGDRHDSTYKKKVGLKLEIVPLENPYAKKVGDTIKFQILFDGKPLADKTVFADNRDGEQFSHQKIVADKGGRFAVKLDRKGVWLVRLVFMQRCKTECGEADWESFWGALSFGVR